MSVQDRGLGSEGSRRSRRDFIRDAAVFGGALAGTPAVLAASAAGKVPTAATATAKPKLGGALRVGVSGGGATDSLDAHKAATNIDFARIRQLYDLLADRDHEYNLVPALGTEFIPNSAGDEMTVKLRPGVTFHNGKPLTAEDVVFTFQRILNPKVGADEAPLLTPVIAGIKAIDPLTVQFKFKIPFNAFEDFAATLDALIVPVGYDPTHPIGTGPFKFESFTPGQQSVFTRNKNYWGAGPYVDSVTIIDIAVDSTRVDALVSGAVDAIDSVPYALLPSVQANGNVEALISKAGNWYPTTMRVDRPPFNDVRVRQAFRLIVDRPQMIADAYGGHARLANDLYAPDDPLYAHLPQREQDIEKAKSLLKQAGRENLTVNLVTAPIENGVVASSVVFAQQAKAAGVNVQVTKLDNTTFYNKQYVQRVFSVDWWSTLSFIATTAYAQTSKAPFNETHYANAQFDKWYFELIGTKKPALQKEIAREMQMQLWTNGGEIIPGFPNNIDSYSKKVTGFVGDLSGYNLGAWDFKAVWFV